MLRTLTLLLGSVCFVDACFVCEASAQYGGRQYAVRQTAMSALGQTGVLRAGGAGFGYRTAATNGAGMSQRGAMGRPTKPFATTTAGPTISPYLNLFREEVEGAVPNYHAFVRPQQDQYEASRAQQAQLQQLQRQVQQASYAAPPSGVAGGARFGDTGRFYGGWRR